MIYIFIISSILCPIETPSGTLFSPIKYLTVFANSHRRNAIPSKLSKNSEAPPGKGRIERSIFEKIWDCKCFFGARSSCLIFQCLYLRRPDTETIGLCFPHCLCVTRAMPEGFGLQELILRRQRQRDQVIICS